MWNQILLRKFSLKCVLGAEKSADSFNVFAKSKFSKPWGQLWWKLKFFCTQRYGEGRGRNAYGIFISHQDIVFFSTSDLSPSATTLSFAVSLNMAHLPSFRRSFPLCSVCLSTGHTSTLSTPTLSNIHRKTFELNDNLKCPFLHNTFNISSNITFCLRWTWASISEYKNRNNWFPSNASILCLSS